MLLLYTARAVESERVVHGGSEKDGWFRNPSFYGSPPMNNPLRFHT